MVRNRKKKLTPEEHERQKEHCRLLTDTTETAYNAIKKVFCPALQREIIFNGKGFYHLRYKPDGTARKVSARIHKLTLFPLVVPVVKNALTVSEIREKEIPESTKKNALKVKVKQYALVAIAGKKNPIATRVIVAEFQGSQEIIFWSVMKN